MCLGSNKSVKVDMPKPPQLPPPLPPPAPPTRKQQAAPKPLTEPGVKPDIRIGSAARSSTGRNDRRQKLGIGGSTNQGLNL